MVNYLAKNIVHFFIKRQIISLSEKNSYIYGFQIIFINIINWGVILFIMLITQQILETLLYMTSVIWLRHHTGGYHAPTHIRCFIISIILYLLILSIIYFGSKNLAAPICLILQAISLIILFKFAPIEHKNNPVNKNLLNRHKYIGRIISLALSLCAILLMSSFPNLYLSISLGILQVSVFLIIEHINKQKEGKSL